MEYRRIARPGYGWGVGAGGGYGWRADNEGKTRVWEAGTVRVQTKYV